MEGREFLYQKDWSLNGVMYHVRCDDWEGFKQAVRNVEAEYITKAPLEPIRPTTAPSDGPACAICGAPVLGEKKITWENKQFWTRDCSSGLRHKTGFFRKAE